MEIVLMKLFCILFLCCSLFLSSCSAKKQEQSSSNALPIEPTTSETLQSDINEPETSSNEITWEYAINEYPQSTYEEIESGTYSNQYVILSCVIESAEYSDLMDWVRCDVWFVYKDIYKLNDIFFKCDTLKKYNPKALQPGDNIDICVYVNIDNSFGNDIISFTHNDKTLTLSEIHDCVPVNFTHCGNVQNDVTDNWRLSKASTNLHSSEYILFYYKNFFKSDNEIHAIINFTDNTTIRIKPILGMLDVSVFSHIDGEENDAKILFGGKLIETYQVNIDTGEIIYLSE